VKRAAIAVVLGCLLVPVDTAAAARSSYATCYNLQGVTASGTYVNKRTAAHNFLFPGTKIRLVGKQAGPNGVRKYVIRDTGPALRDGHFDLWSPGGCTQFGVRPIHWKFGWGK
jgi:3D (Asp-Asp-Asp) domain-containing protein